MGQIAEDYVSFETAKLLKEKGFDEACEHYYRKEIHMGNEYNLLMWTDEPVNNNAIGAPIIYPGFEATAPTLQMATKWLREAHNILLVVDYIYECTNTSYVYKIYRLGQNGRPERDPIIGMSLKDNKEHVVGYHDYKLSYKDYATYEEAAEEGIKYCLENLI